MQESSTMQVDDTGNCIIDAALPDAVNFAFLKQTAIEQLQETLGAVWSNYNDSDPGVTILDQLCYALTELGYCAQFPIADVLTQADGKIHYHDQFFEPQEILTTSPVTIDDYRRLIHDQVPEVRVVYIVPEQLDLPGMAATPAATASGRYRTLVGLQQGHADPDANVLQRIYVLLNQHRNIAEVFLPPQLLSSQAIALLGSVVLNPGADAAQVLGGISDALLNYCAPLPVRSGYQELLAQGKSADQIFDGPAMRGGWICGAGALGRKRSSVSLFELYRVIAGIPGVAYVETLNFAAAALTAPGDGASIAVGADAWPVIALDPTFSLQVNGTVLAAAASPARSGAQYLEALRSRHQASSIEAKAALSPPLPHGRYREIEQYYSVQNTFPDQYNIGPNSLRSDAPSYKVARSRQLKGYLMPFDQLLANQFSQLAGVGDLFSFHPPRVHTPPHSRLQANPAPVDVHGIGHRHFSRTYFCQPLYDIPDVKPLLAGHDDFRYQFQGAGNAQLIGQAAWTAYRHFPFNRYVSGLQQGLESEREANARRDGMLNHLMARHGDDFSCYDDVIRSCPWMGKEVETRIVVKSIWLQNFQKLSYRRNRAFDCLSPATLPLPHDKPTSAIPCVYPSRDGMPDQAAIYTQARLRQRDFAQCSTFEIKAGILLGLAKHYLGLASRLRALLAAPDFAKCLGSPGGGRQTFYLQDSDTSVQFGVQASDVAGVRKDQLFEGQKCLLDIAWTNGMPPSLADYQAHAEQLLWLATERHGTLMIEPVLLLPAAPLSDARGADYFLNAYLLLPGYVHLIQDIIAAGSFATIERLHWPVHLHLNYRVSTFNWLRAFIPSFVLWNNSHPAPGKPNHMAARLARLLQLPVLEG